LGEDSIISRRVKKKKTITNQASYWWGPPTKKKNTTWRGGGRRGRGKERSTEIGRAPVPSTSRVGKESWTSSMKVVNRMKKRAFKKRIRKGRTAAKIDG